MMAPKAEIAAREPDCGEAAVFDPAVNSFRFDAVFSRDVPDGEGAIGHVALPMNQSLRAIQSSDDMSLIRLLSWSTDFIWLAG
jgi:hypothetical protein